VVLFPDEFDPLLGYAYVKYESEPGVYYVDGKCDALGTAYMKSFHWEVSVSGTSSVEALTDVTIEI
jgi:hypothetical protein